MKKVFLHGELGSKFGKEFALDVDSLPELLRAIDANCDGFLDYLMNTVQKGVGYTFLSEKIQESDDREAIEEKIISDNDPKRTDLIKEEVYIMPVVQGADFVSTAITLAAKFFTSKAFFQAVLMAAVTYGISQLTKPPEPPKVDSDRVSSKSYILNGASNRQAQGIPVPVAYGRLKIGSVNIGAEKQIKRKDSAETAKGNDVNSLLESYSKFKYLDLLCEGPIEGLVDEEGNLINIGKNEYGELIGAEDLGKAIYLNDVPIKNNQNQLNYILTEDDEDAIEYKKGDEDEVVILNEGKACYSKDYNIVLYGPSPYIGAQSSDSSVNYQDALKLAQESGENYEGEIKFAKDNGAKIVSHAVLNNQVKEIDIGFKAELQFDSLEGNAQKTKPLECKFVIMVQRNGWDYNVLNADSGCTVEIDREFIGANLNNTDVTKYKSGIVPFVKKQDGAAFSKSRFGFNHWAGLNQEAQDVVSVKPIQNQDWINKFLDPNDTSAESDLVEESFENYVNKNQEVLNEYLIEAKGESYFMVGGIATSAAEFKIKIKIDWDFYKRNDIDKNRGIIFKVIRLDPELDPTLDSKAKNGSGIYNRKALQFSYVQETVKADLRYPHSVISSIVFDSRNFGSVPTRKYHGKFKKIAVPTNYNPSTRKYDGPWDGRFKGQKSGQSLFSIKDGDKIWSDNPAWIFYDLILNPRFGVAKYGVSEFDVDKWQLYKISKYCDELVDTEYEIETKNNIARPFNTNNEVKYDLNGSDGYIEVDIEKYFWHVNDEGQLIYVDKYLSDPNYLPDGVGSRSIPVDSSNINIIFQDLIGRSATSDESSRYIGNITVENLIQILLEGEDFIQPIYSEQDFIREFGDGEKFKGKKVAFFMNDHSFNVFSGDNKKEIQKKSCVREGSYSIEERVLLKSIPSERRIFVSGPNFSESSNTINGLTYGGCACQVNHSVVEPRFTCNTYLSDKANALQALNAMSSIFRGIVAYHGGKISPVQDGPKKPVRIFNNSNVSNEGFIYAGAAKTEKFTSSIVRFNNKEKGFAPDIIFQEDIKGIQRLGFLEKETIGFGITSPSQARRLARWNLITSHLEGEVIKFNTSLEGNSLAPGLIFEVADDMRSESSRSGRVLQIEMSRKFNQSTLLYPTIKIDKSLKNLPAFSRLEISVSVGRPSQGYEDINRRAQSEKSEDDQDVEIANIFSQQILRFDCTLESNLNKNPQHSILKDLVLKQEFEVSVKDNLIKNMFHGLENGDKVRFLTSGVLPGGIYKNRVAERAYTVTNKTDHTFQILEYNATTPVNIIDTGRDYMSNSGGDHYFCQEPDIGSIQSSLTRVTPKTVEALNQISEGCAYIIKGLLLLKEDPTQEILFNSSELENLKIDPKIQPRSRDWVYSQIFGYINILNENWVYSSSMGWISISSVTNADPTSEGYWFFIQEMGWAWVKKDDYTWWNFSFYPNNDTPWIGPWVYVKKDENDNIDKLFIQDSNASSKSVGQMVYFGGTAENSIGKEVQITKIVTTGVNIGYWVALSFTSDTTNVTQEPDVGSGPGPLSSQSQYDNPGLEVTSIADFEPVSADKSIQGKNSIRLFVDHLGDIDLTKNLVMDIKGVAHENQSSNFQQKINETFSFIFIDDFRLEILNSEDLYDDFIADGNNFDSYGYISIINGMSFIKKFNQESKLYRTLSVKEVNNNEFEITGGEYNPAKFRAVDEIKHLRKPFLPIPPQADMDIPDAPKNLNLFDLTFRGNSAGTASTSSGTSSGY